MPKDLAIFGGQPVRKTYLNYGRQDISSADIAAVTGVLKSDYLTTGPVVKAFEDKVCEIVGVPYGISISNGTAGLHMACHVLGLGAGDEVIVPALTFAASANAVLYTGARPVFADIDPVSYLVDPQDIAKKITPRTKAIIAVDFMGHSPDMVAIRALADQHDLKIIQDSAHGLGSYYKGQHNGAYADLSVYSFHPVKPVTTGEGGLVTTRDPELYEKMKMFRSHGITKDKAFLEKEEGPWHYEMQFLGYNYRMTDIQGALGLSQLDRLGDFIKRRREIVALYNLAFEEEEGLIRPYEAPEVTSGYHLYIIKLNLQGLKAGRLEIFKALQAENIGVNVHYIPVYYHPYYKALGYEKGLCRATEDLYDRMVTLPLYPGMTQQDVDDVIAGVKKVLSYYKV